MAHARDVPRCPRGWSNNGKVSFTAHGCPFIEEIDDCAECFEIEEKGTANGQPKKEEQEKIQRMVKNLNKPKGGAL